MDLPRKAKIVCTIGPATSSKKRIKELIEAGMDVARLNFSHGDYNFYKEVIDHIRICSKKLKRNIAILQDLQGVKIRVGKVRDGGILLKKGQKINIMVGDGECSEDTIYITYPWLIQDASINDRILIDDGLIQLDVIEKAGCLLVATVVEPGILKDKKGINLPHMKIRKGYFTEKDMADLKFGMECGVDFVAISFVRSADDIVNVKKFMEENGRTIPVIAKIEKEEAIKDIDNILNEADGIMVARGDLGVEMPIEEVPVIQKMLIKKANDAMKIVITATQMLESMTQHLRPTRAEATDVANAVIDGTDALMLSAETSVGKHPVEAVKMMDTIIRFTEKAEITSKKSIYNADEYYAPGPSSVERAIARAVAIMAKDLTARFIVAFSRTGFTAKLISKFRPYVPVIAFSPNESVVRQMSIYHGVSPHFVRNLTDTDEMIKEVNEFILKNRFAAKGEKVIIVASHPVSKTAKTNFVKVHVLE
ncbi:MAG: pyruvate kinase [Syntrophorhabdaceae bacterium]|nr:pyruvate kinase [Syntrophorhabdaceae bacterium]